MMMLLQERELGELLGDIARRIFGNLGQIAAIVFVFGLPLIESLRRSRREAREKARGGAPRPGQPAQRPRQPAAPGPSREQARREDHGREVWEALLRGEQPPAPPPPVAPPAAPAERRPQPQAEAPRPVLTASVPTPPVDEETLASRVMERDLERGRAMSSGGLQPLATSADEPATRARRAARLPRSARELVLASEVLAGPVALRSLDSGGSLPPGLAAW